MDAVKTIIVGNFTGRIFNDETPESPRQWDNLGTMICRHKRYDLGDANDLDFSNCSSWADDEKVIKSKFGSDAIMLPLYMYDHSGITMSTTPFSCSWDSGRVGTIVVSREEIRKEWNIKRITAKRQAQMEEILKGEVKTYDQYLTGDVYGYEIVENMVADDGEEYEEHRDSSWGHYGLDGLDREVGKMLIGYHKEQELVMDETKQIKKLLHLMVREYILFITRD